MGTGQSTTRRRVQPSLPYPLHYDRLSPSNSNSVSELLLLSHMEEEEDDLLNQQDNLETTESIRNEKIIAAAYALEKQVCEIRSRVSSLESNPPPSKALIQQIIQIQASSKKIEAMEKEIAHLKSKVSGLESKPHSTASSKQETVIINLKQKNVDLENKLMKLTATVDQLKHHTLDSAGAVVAEAQIRETKIAEPRIPGPEINDLMGCLMVLIFLISVLIGTQL